MQQTRRMCGKIAKLCRQQCLPFEILIRSYARRHSLHRQHPRKRLIQYSKVVAIDPRGRSILDTPLEPVIGLAVGETRWRGMTDYCGVA
jgi:hypothetical protein